MSTAEELLPRAVFDYVKAERKPRPGDDWWHFSDSGYCHRKRILARDEQPCMETRQESLLVFEYGHRVESIVRKALTKRFDCAVHGRVQMSKHHVRGTFDLMAFVPDLEEAWMIDVKSASGTSFKFNTERGNDQYRQQVVGYADAVEQNGYTLEKVGLVGEDQTDECVEERGPVKIDKCVVLYVNKEYGNVFADVFDRRPYQQMLLKDYESINLEWERYKKDGSLPAEKPMEAAKPGSKHVKAGRVKAGQPCPQGLCSPLYCPYIPHCTAIASWWRKCADFDLTLPKAATKES